jgi:hypothetical protein
VSDQGDGDDHVQAARAEDGSFLIAYLPRGRAVSIHMDKISGSNVKCRWFDPRQGTWQDIGTYPNVRERASLSRHPREIKMIGSSSWKTLHGTSLRSQRNRRE